MRLSVKKAGLFTGEKNTGEKITGEKYHWRRTSQEELTGREHGDSIKLHRESAAFICYVPNKALHRGVIPSAREFDHLANYKEREHLKCVSRIGLMIAGCIICEQFQQPSKS